MLWKKVLTTLVLCISWCMYADELSDAFNGAVDGAKNSFSGVSNMVDGMAAAFTGECHGANCYYTFAVWNDSPGPILAAREDVKKVLGADFDGDVIEAYAIDPYKHFGGSPGVPFYHAHLYYKIALQIDKNNEHMYEQYGTTAPTSRSKPSWHSLYRKNIAIPDPDSSHVYYYRVYSQQGVVKAEYLGMKTTTDQFNGVFFNNSSFSGITLKFLKNKKTYQVTLEPGTFSTLSSDTEVEHSIRPDSKEQRYFTFLRDNKQFMQLPIPVEGIANMMQDPKNPKKFIAGDPMVYTYEVYQGSSGPSVGLQGLSIGHYTQMIDPKSTTKAVVRDINPVECHVWLQSAAQALQAQKASKDTPSFLDFPGQVWIIYQTHDSVIQQKITPGSVADFTLVRPQIAEQQAYLYVVALDTTDDAKAKQWLARFTKGTIGKDAHKLVAPIQKFDAATVLSTIMPSPYGTIDDTAQGGSGVVGKVLLVDAFSPRGVGFGPFYYTINPMLIQLDQLRDTFVAFLDGKKMGTESAKEAFYQQFDTKLIEMIQTYPSKPQAVINQIFSWLQQYGYDRLFENPQASGSARVLNSLGKKARDILISGPVSIQNYPAFAQAGSNEYVLSGGQKPTTWPATRT